MLFINKTLPRLGFSAIDTEFISSVFTTWGHKLNTIVTSIATGIAISLVPSIAESKAKAESCGAGYFKDKKLNFGARKISGTVKG